MDWKFISIIVIKVLEDVIFHRELVIDHWNKSSSNIVS